MIEDGHLVRVDVDQAGVTTVRGVRIGDTQKRTWNRSMVRSYKPIPRNTPPTKEDII